jgi:hypothetical protein
MINPELTKNCWLEITPHRLYVTPVVILLLAWLMFLNGDDAVERGANLDTMFSVIAFLFACVGGAYHCTLSMINEFSDHTWDQQRMSPMSPWTLTWGKLFGGAGFMWYGALLSLGLLLLVPLFFPPLWNAVQRIEMVLMIVGIAIFAQASGLLMVISAANSPDRLSRYRRNYGAGLALTVIIGGSFLFGLLSEVKNLLELQHWWWQQWPLQEFWLLVVVVFAAWAALGAYRVMREQMQFRNGRLPWLCFNLFLMAFITGFFFAPESDTNWHMALLVAFGVSLVLAYALLIAQPIPQVEIQRLVTAFKSRQWIEVWQSLPLWVVSIILAGILSVIDIVIPRVQFSSMVPEHLLLELLLFALRDCSIFIFFLIGKKPSRVTITGIFYLILLYTIVPLLILQIGWSDALGFFWPLYKGQVTLLPIFIEVVVLGVLIYRRWRGYLGQTLSTVG